MTAASQSTESIWLEDSKTGNFSRWSTSDEESTWICNRCGDTDCDPYEFGCERCGEEADQY